MPVRNARPFLNEAIASILAQTLDSFELVITDDHSTDGSAEIISSYRDPRIRVVPVPEHRNVAYVRNLGLAAARGEYVAVLDADDVAYPQRLESQVDYLDRHPDVVLVGSGFDMLNAEGRKLQTERPTAPRAGPLLDPLSIRWRLLFGNCLTHSTVMYRRGAALAAGGYDERMTVASEYGLYVNLSQVGEIVQLDEVLSQWRKHWGSLTYTASEFAVRDVAGVVVRSIQHYLGKTVSLEAARTLNRNPAGPAPGLVALGEALETWERCLEHAWTLKAHRERERRQIVLLALDDLFRIARFNPSCYAFALRRAIAWVSRSPRPGGLVPSLLTQALRTAVLIGFLQPFIGPMSLAAFRDARKRRRSLTR
jgi:hypothetical protein